MNPQFLICIEHIQTFLQYVTEPERRHPPPQKSLHGWTIYKPVEYVKKAED